MDVMDLRTFEKLSPFEIKDELIKLAKKTSRRTQSAFLNVRPRKPELDRDHCARGLLSPRAVCDHGKQVCDGASRRSWRHAEGERDCAAHGDVARQAL